MTIFLLISFFAIAMSNCCYHNRSNIFTLCDPGKKQIKMQFAHTHVPEKNSGQGQCRFLYVMQLQTLCKCSRQKQFESLMRLAVVLPKHALVRLFVLIAITAE